jgi:benzoyl-CoA reductase subunit C
MFRKFQDWYETRHEYARAWKNRTGGKVVGYFCTYVPEEILCAANILPVRILGHHEAQDLTEPHIFGMFCPFCRDCLAQGLQGRYDYLDGIIIAQSCLHIRQAFTSWQLHIPVSYSYYIPMPHHVQSPRAYPYLESELRRFKESLETWIGKEISRKDLDRGIEVVNTQRRLLRSIYELRRGANPPLTGAEAMLLSASAQWTDKEEHSLALSGLLESGLSSRNLNPVNHPRLMLVGSEDDDIAFVDMVESCGAVVVVDDHCTGSRYFWNEALPQENRLGAIAARYINRPPCPTKDWPNRKKLQHVLELAKDWNVQGAIFAQQKFCDPHELDVVEYQKKLEEAGIPTLCLELDVTVPVGQFKVRAEAFLETLMEEDLF